MGLMQRAYETYCAMEADYVGRYEEGQTEPLAPISHMITAAQIEITLDAQGNFIRAVSVDKSEPKIIIPVTEESAGRTGYSAINCPHPLSDKLKYLIAEDNHYIPQLERWAMSAYHHPKVEAVLSYVKKGTVFTDLQQFGLIKETEGKKAANEDNLIRWRVLSQDGEYPEECWKDRSLFQSFIDYYATIQSAPEVFCMVSGQQDKLAGQHPKGIIALNGNAKLISANDSSGFTYRGRFTDDQQAATVSYAISQKTHSALRWIAVNQGGSFGGRTFLCWNPQGIRLPQLGSPMLRKITEKQVTPSEYKQELQNTLKGWKEQLPPDASAIIAAFDAATTGRLALTYYSELQASDFLERLHAWDASCCWWNRRYGTQSPSLFQIVNFAFGTPRAENQQTRFETDDRVMRQQIQRLISCRVDKGKLPLDIEQALVKRASNLQILDSGQREAFLFTACAVIKKYHFDRNGEEWKMALEPNKQDLSYQYGRLLAVLEKIERDTYDKDENRETNAFRMLSVYARRPQYASQIIWEQLRKAYYPRLKPGCKIFYERLIGEIMEKISLFPAVEQNRPLGDTYLLGYYLQRNELYQSKTEQNETEE